MKCDHQFVRVADIVRLSEKSSKKQTGTVITGAKVVCALCAEKRDIFIDGTIHIWKKKGKIQVVELPTEYINRILKKNISKK